MRASFSRGPHDQDPTFESLQTSSHYFLKLQIIVGELLGRAQRAAACSFNHGAGFPLLATPLTSVL